MWQQTWRHLNRNDLPPISAINPEVAVNRDNNLKPVSAMPFMSVKIPCAKRHSADQPVIAPAWRRKRCVPPLFLAASSCSRMRRPTGTPVRRDVSFNQSSSSSVRRIVSVGLIRNTYNIPVHSAAKNSLLRSYHDHRVRPPLPDVIWVLS